MMTRVFRRQVWKIQTILEEDEEDPVEVERRPLQDDLFRHHRQKPAARMNCWEVLVEDHRLVSVLVAHKFEKGVVHRIERGEVHKTERGDHMNLRGQRTHTSQCVNPH
jgi:hypothetical protein